MTQAEFIGMMVLCGSVLIGLFAAIYSPLTKNTQTMTRLTLTMEQLIKRMDDQEGSLKEHVRDFEAYKEHVKDSQRRQWDEIDKHHDELVKHEHAIKTIKDSIKEQEEREC